MNKKPIIVYWSEFVDLHTDPDWSFLYPNPVTLFRDHFKDKKKESSNHFFMCPASANKMKKTLVFNSPLTFGYDYDFTDGKTDFKSISKEGVTAYSVRDIMLSTGPNFKVGLGWSFFASESLEASFTSPFFHKTKYMESCSTIPGNFDIGQWYRPYSLEIQTWSNKGKIEFIEDEPLFYVEFKTDRPIIIKRYRQTELLTKYTRSCIDTTSMFGLGQTLQTRYNRFKSTSMRGKILDEINNNIIDEDFIQL
jgi:hypothetical protein